MVWLDINAGAVIFQRVGAVDPVVYALDFSGASQVKANGTPVDTFFDSSTDVFTAPTPGTVSTPGVYSIRVRDPAGVSNAVPFTGDT